MNRNRRKEELQKDVYHLVLDAPPKENVIVSSYSDGSVASRYYDIIWDWSPYNKNNRICTLSFKFWKSGEITAKRLELANELRWLLYLKIHYHEGSPISYATLRTVLKLGHPLARYCEERNKSIKNIISSGEELTKFSFHIPEYQLHALASLISQLGKLGKDLVGYSVPGDNLHRMLRKEANKHAETNKQFAPIPTRIFSHIINSLSKELTDFEIIADNYFRLVEDYLENPKLLSFGRVTNEEKESSKWLVLEKYGLRRYFEETGLSTSANGIQHGLNIVQTSARLTILLFTGMRNEETTYLPLDSLKSEFRNGNKHYYLRGYTTKLSHGLPKETRWVTSDEGARAAQLAAKISEFIVNNMLVELDDTKKIPLFPSVIFLGINKSNYRTSRKLHVGTLSLNKVMSLKNKLQLTITQNDIVELEHIDPKRSWRTEEQFKIGNSWNLTPHQFRRSLALYAQRSGLVSLQTLKRQLQQITDEMVLYYSRGSALANNIVGGNRQHFGNEWQDAQPVSSALSYISNVLMSNVVLFGGHANWIKHRKMGSDGKMLADREKTLEDFKKGKISYRETLLGGCVSTEDCDKSAIKWLNTECLKGCKNFIGNIKKLKRTILAQENMIKAINPDTVEYRTESENLKVLKEEFKKINGDADI